MFEAYCPDCGTSEIMIKLVPGLYCPECKLLLLYQEWEGEGSN